jgi:hypothetical protein
MQPGYPGSGQEPYGTQPPYRDPYAQPHYSSAAPDERNASTSGDDEPSAVPPAAHAAQPPPPVPEQRAVPPAPPPAASGPDADLRASPHANTVGLIAMVLGVLSVPSAFCTPLGIPIAVVFGVAGVVLGIIGLRKVRNAAATNRGQCVAGLVGGIVGLLAAVAGAAALAYNGAG